jgi:hypothetical protein
MASAMARPAGAGSEAILRARPRAHRQVPTPCVAQVRIYPQTEPPRPATDSQPCRGPAAQETQAVMQAPRRAKLRGRQAVPTPCVAQRPTRREMQQAHPATGFRRYWRRVGPGTQAAIMPRVAAADGAIPAIRLCQAKLGLARRGRARVGTAQPLPAPVVLGRTAPARAFPAPALLSPCPGINRPQTGQPRTGPVLARPAYQARQLGPPAH